MSLTEHEVIFTPVANSKNLGAIFTISFSIIKAKQLVNVININHLG